MQQYAHRRRGSRPTVLHGEQTVSEFATNLDRSLSYTSELVERLETAGLVEARRQGKTKQIRLSDAKALELLTDLTQQYSHIDWPELLSGGCPPCLLLP